jgi:hypothetical protein
VGEDDLRATRQTWFRGVRHVPWLHIQSCRIRLPAICRASYGLLQGMPVPTGCILPGTRAV